MMTVEMSNPKTIWDLFTGYKTGRNKFLEAVKTCGAPDDMMVAPLQDSLTVTFYTDFLENSLLTGFTSQNPPYSGWGFQIRLGEAYGSFIPNWIAIQRGAFYSSLVYHNIIGQHGSGFCNEYFDPMYTDLNLSFISVVNIHVWLLLIVVIFIYSFIWKNLRQWGLFMIAIGRSIDVPGNIRKYVYTYLVCATFFSWIYDSHVYLLKIFG